MTRLDGKVAIITGAANGMGETHTREFVKEGAKVVITDVQEEAGKKLAEELGENAIFVKLDVTKLEDWKNVLEKAKEAFGAVNILVNNAGYAGPFAHTADLEIEAYHRVINIDQNGTFYGMRTLIPHMVESGGGSIVNIASIAGSRHVFVSSSAAYTAAKHAVLGLTKAAAIEYGDKNIRVNAVLPGVILTPMVKENLPQEQQDAVGAKAPLRRLGDPREVTKVVTFLASDDSSFVSGAEYVVDGGLLAE